MHLSIGKTKHSHENVKYLSKKINKTQQKNRKKQNKNKREKQTHHILKQASIDSLLNHHHSKLWFKRRTYRLECRQKLCRFMGSSKLQLSISNSITEQNNLFWIVLIELNERKNFGLITRNQVSMGHTNV